MKVHYILILILGLIVISCGQNGGEAVSIGSGTSPFPKIKADCNNASCM